MFDIKFFIIIGLVIALLFMYKEINYLKTSIETLNYQYNQPVLTNNQQVLHNQQVNNQQINNQHVNNQQINNKLLQNRENSNLITLPNESCNLTSIIEEESINNTTNNNTSDDDDKEMMLLLKNDDNVVENYSNDDSESNTSKYYSDNSKLASITTKSIEKQKTDEIVQIQINKNILDSKLDSKLEENLEEELEEKLEEELEEKLEEELEEKLEEHLEEHLDVSIIDKNKLDPEKLIREKKLAELQDMAERLNIELIINGKKKTKIQLANEICNNNQRL